MTFDNNSTINSEINTNNSVIPSTPIASTPLPSTPFNDPQNGSGIRPTLQNIVSTVNLETRLDLKTIALHARNAEYNPK
eukprot:jgi/Orpsp1_1/1187075/evm.model.d7180000055239.1